MEGGVEAGNLRHARVAFRQRLDHRHRRGVVQRRQRLQRLDQGDRRRVQVDWRGVIRAAMHHAMPEANETAQAERPIPQLRQHCQRLGVVRHREPRVVHRVAVVAVQA